MRCFLRKSSIIVKKQALLVVASFIGQQLTSKTSILHLFPYFPIFPSFINRHSIQPPYREQQPLQQQVPLKLINAQQQLLLIIIYMNRSISTLSSFKQNKNTNNQNRHKTPKRIINGVKLYNFSEIGSYKHINKPYLNEVKKEHIKHKLDLEKATEIRVARRIKKNETFIAYNFNPFNVKKPHSKSQSHMPHQDDRNHQNSRNIIDEINTLQNRKLNKQIESKQLDSVRNEAIKVSTLIQRQLNNATPERTGLVKPKKQQLNKSMISLRPKEPISQYEVQKLPGQMDFLDIIQLREQKYSGRREKELNIFRLLYDNSMFNSNIATLDKFCFSFNSLFQKFQKYKIQTYRDISREARTNAMKRPAVKENQNFDTFVQTQLKFSDLLNVASGRFTPEVVYSQMHFDRMNDNTNIDNEEDQLIYKEGTWNKSTLVENQNQSMKEIQEFLKLAFSKKQQAYHKLNVFRKEQIADKLGKISKLVSLSIYDKKLHEELRRQINGEMAMFTDENYKYPKGTIQRDMLIRTNKESKNKNEIIKLTQLIETFKLTKQHETHVKALINKRI